MGVEKSTTSCLTEESQRLLDQLRSLSKKQLRLRFTELRSPSIHEMNGEYQAELLDQGNLVAALAISSLFNFRATWTGKAFCPISDTRGQGYNRFQKRRTVVRRHRMETTIHKSQLDESDAFRLDYHRLNSGMVGTMVDEIRRVCPGLYLGFGDVLLSRRFSISRKIFFALIGPQAAYHDSERPSLCDQRPAA